MLNKVLKNPKNHAEKNSIDTKEKCRHLKFFFLLQHFALPSMSLIFLRNGATNEWNRCFSNSNFRTLGYIDGGRPSRLNWAPCTLRTAVYRPMKACPPPPSRSSSFSLIHRMRALLVSPNRRHLFFQEIGLIHNYSLC